MSLIGSEYLVSVEAEEFFITVETDMIFSPTYIQTIGTSRTNTVIVTDMKMAIIDSGALTGGVAVSVPHGLTDCTKFAVSAGDGIKPLPVWRELCVDPAFPNTHVLIQSPVNFPSVKITVIGAP